MGVVERVYDILVDGLVIGCFFKVFCKVLVIFRKCVLSIKGKKRGFEYFFMVYC